MASTLVRRKGNIAIPKHQVTLSAEDGRRLQAVCAGIVNTLLSCGVSNRMPIVTHLSNRTTIITQVLQTKRITAQLFQDVEGFHAAIDQVALTFAPTTTDAHFPASLEITVNWNLLHNSDMTEREGEEEKQHLDGSSSAATAQLTDDADKPSVDQQTHDDGSDNKEDADDDVNDKRCSKLRAVSTRRAVSVLIPLVLLAVTIVIFVKRATIMSEVRDIWNTRIYLN